MIHYATVNTHLTHNDLLFDSFLIQYNLQIADSALALVFAFENCVDFISSAVVLWRFFAPSWKVDEETEHKLNRREKRASIAISFVLVLLGLMVIAAAINAFKNDNDDGDGDTDAVIALSFMSVPIFATLTAFKFQYAKHLDSASLYKDGLCSLLGTILSAALFLNLVIIRSNPSLDWIDPLISLFCGFMAMYLGLEAIYSAKWKDGLPIFTIRWWVSSQGDGTDETSGRPVEAADRGDNGNIEMKQHGSDDGEDEDMEDAEII